MNYLFQYLRTLTPQEEELLRAVPLTPREGEVLATLLALRETPEVTKEEAVGRLRMSGAMFDKTCSLLLRHAFAAIVPQGGLPLLRDLCRRGPRPLFLHEMKRQEKELREEGDTERRAGFYRSLFDLLHERFGSDYDEKLSHRIARRLLALQPSPDNAIYCDACILGARIWTIAAQGTGKKMKETIGRRLEAVERRVTPQTDPVARFRLMNARIVYHGQFGYDPERRLELLRESVALCDAHPDVLPLEIKVGALCKIAEEHYFYRTDLKTPYLMYRDLFRRHADLLATDYYHATKFFQLSLINGDHKGAEKLLRKYYGYDLRMEIAGRSKMGAINWTKFFLVTGKMEEARRFLDLAFEQNQKKFYVQYEVECRLLQTAWFYLNGDFETVELMAPANIKYLRSKDYTFTSSRFYPWFFKLALALIDERKLGKPLPAKLEAKYEEFMEGAAAQYGILLRKMRNER